MKKLALTATIIAVLVFGAVAMAYAASNSVTVSANVNNVFTMTISDAAVGFGTVAPGDGVVAGDKTPVITVKSNKPWTFSSGSADYSGISQSGALNAAALDAIFQRGYSVTQGSEGARGVTDLELSYSLDMDDSGAWELNEGAQSVGYTYTALQ